MGKMIEILVRIDRHNDIAYVTCKRRVSSSKIDDEERSNSGASLSMLHSERSQISPSI